MISHGDRVHYALSGLGSWPATSAFGALDKKRDAGCGVACNGQRRPKGAMEGLLDLRRCFGGLPGGDSRRALSAERLGADKLANEYDGRLFPIEDIVNKTKICPNFSQSVLSEIRSGSPAPTAGSSTTTRSNTQGSPSRTTRSSISASFSSIDEVDRAVIMISAFPEEKPIRQEGEPHSDIVSIFSALMPALINQARFKPDELRLPPTRRMAAVTSLGRIVR